MIEVLRSMRLPSWVVPLSLSMACGSPSLPGPKLVAHPSTDLAPVEYPPPPARAEVVPAKPDGDAVWVDGEWSFRGKKWRWHRGRWVEHRSELRFAPWTAVRSQDGQLYVAEGRWVDAKGNQVDEPRLLAEAPPSKSIVINEQGEDEDVGRDIRSGREGGARANRPRQGEQRETDGGEP